MANKKAKAPVFNEETDKKINSFAFGISFSLISVFLLTNKTYFALNWITNLVGAIFGFFGLAGIGTEIDKSQKFKGVGNLVLGVIFTGAWFVIYTLTENWLVNTLIFVLLCLGVFAFALGIIQFLYSVFEAIKTEETLSKKMKPIFAFITQMCGLVLTILNILKVFKIL